jgi:hypothetical protein
MEEREIRRAMAKASLRESWLRARVSGLDQMSEQDIDREIHAVRTHRKSLKKIK